MAIRERTKAEPSYEDTILNWLGTALRLRAGWTVFHHRQDWWASKITAEGRRVMALIEGAAVQVLVASDLARVEGIRLLPTPRLLS